MTKADGHGVDFTPTSGKEWATRFDNFEPQGVEHTEFGQECLLTLGAHVSRHLRSTNVRRVDENFWHGEPTFLWVLISNHVARYPQGTAVDVRYNPDDPAQAVLESTAEGLWLFWAVGLIFVAVSTVFILIQWP